MHLFELLIILHVAAGATGLAAFWVPVATGKGSKTHRKWGRIACYGFMVAGVLAIAMALLSLYGPEERIPSITDRELFAGLFGWMMLYLGLLTLGFADYGLSVVKHSQSRAELRRPRYQVVMASVVISALWCGYFGVRVGHPLMQLVAGVGLIAMFMQQVFVWRATVSPVDYKGEHFRALIGMGISAYTAFLSVGLIRLVPDQVFNPLIWAGPSIIGVGLIIYFTLQTKSKSKRAAIKA
ncbi:hypothetical protein FGU71_09835 [Erythrobacter insulae]|uniref:DUF2306 domain-containing protein n=1 Tax=Erythrobacter insulae TaxID=2584124 RepID=A0A547PDC3_9SPHN|nr:hypothetical protein [Erythrobacter insulae]TRD12129.1 hypothetical protein FGU71_09835 [Erythrobacter insulae]